MAEKKEKRYVSDNAQLMAEWDWEKNIELGFDPQKLTCGSGRKAWWLCSNGHGWQASIDTRSKGHRCPYCSGRYAIQGMNDLKTINPILAKEWNYEKNNGIKLESIKGNSNKKVWWKCEKGHEWQAVIHTRNKGIGCPICKSERNTSFPEYVIFYYLREHGLEPIHSYKGYGYELDIYVPSKKIAIEYDGYYWHKNKIKKELDKNKKCQNDGITLYRIREELPSLNDTSIDYVVRKDQKNLPDVLKIIIQEITGESVEIDIDRDYIYVENIREYAEKSNSFLVSNPKLVKEWNYEKNGNLKPQNITSNSSKKVWWKCEKGHEWQARVDSRTCGNNCPYCSGRYAIVGKTDLRTINPTLAQDWNYEKNVNLNPENFTPNSGKKVWWKCDNGHEWQATINSRSRGVGCPYCSRRRADASNHLQAINPSLAAEWNFEKNNGLTPSDVMPKSGKKVWWKCDNGHEWQATITSRSSGNGCPYCAGKKVLPGYNDLQTINPTLANEWNFEKNHEIVPAAVSPNSHAKVWWKCRKEHEWQATIHNRNYGYGCPYCAGQKVSRGINDLQTVNPLLAEDWNYEKNNDLTPSDVMPNSGKKVWWRCTQGHEWEAVIGSRSKGAGCPECAKQKRKKKDT